MQAAVETEPAQRPAGDDDAQGPLLRTEQLQLGFGDKVVLKDLDFEVRRREVFVIMGASGGGKSTLLRSLIGLLEPQSGRVLYGDRDLYGGDADAMSAARREFGVMFQAGALWSSMTVGENVMLPLQLLSQLSPAEREADARFKLALVGLGDSFDAEPSDLSGGMKKRAAIARAMALNPPLLFLDEPSAGLDPLTSARLDDLILHLRDNFGTTVVMVTHELDSIFATADRAMFLDRQTVAAIGPPKELARTGPDAVRDFLARKTRP